MSISAEDIKAGRERKMMTQRELADEVGVSLRTINSWERGETVPRNRTAVIAEVLGLDGAREFGEEALLRRLGQLAKRRREELGIGRVPLAKEVGMGSDSTIRDFEFGRRLMSGTNQRRLEKALSWRPGVIDDVMRMLDRKASTIEMEELYLEAPKGTEGLALVSNEDLIEELRRRLGATVGPVRTSGPDTAPRT